MDCVVMTHFLGDFFNSPIKWFNWRISASFSSTPNPPDFRHTYNPLQFFHARTRLPFCTSLLLQSPVFFPHYLSHPFSFLTSPSPVASSPRRTRVGGSLLTPSSHRPTCRCVPTRAHFQHGEHTSWRMLPDNDLSSDEMDAFCDRENTSFTTVLRIRSSMTSFFPAHFSHNSTPLQ